MLPVLLFQLATKLPPRPRPAEAPRAAAPAAVAATRLHDEAVTVDGRLEEPLWRRAQRITAFVQSDPIEGAAPSESTVVYVAYDDAALYIGARLYDPHPDSIVARLGRRDDATGSDQFTVYLDPNHDRRTGYFFGVDAAGTLSDGTLYNDDWNGDSWDAVWDGRARRDSLGWTVEMRIPISQLRFRAGAPAWGVDFERDIARRHEKDLLVFTPKNGSGFVSRFVDLDGMGALRPRRELELVPYTRGEAEYARARTGDPYHSGAAYSPGFGLDARIGVGANLTLSATINPDFGQVEVDPAVVNLSDVETFFDEKRPFFVEGASLFDNFGFNGANNYWGFNWSGPQLFYSRRIGRAPQGGVPTGANADSSYADVPAGTHIVGALKLTGTAFGGWSVGALSALTARETAAVDTSGVRFAREVEPLAYYGVARAMRDFGGGRAGIGFMATTALHDVSDPAIRGQVNRGAYTGGVEGWVALDARKVWMLQGWAGGSLVAADAARITALETGPIHYFQQPDQRHVRVDSAATTLAGSAARVTLNKQSGNVYVNAAFGWQSPGLDVTDLGFQFLSGVYNGSLVGGYRWTRPGRVFRQASFYVSTFRSYDYDGNISWSGVWSMTSLQLLDYSQLQLNVAYNPWSVSDRRTRGGPLSLTPPGYEVDVLATSDARKATVLSLQGSSYQSPDDRMVTAGATVQVRPAAGVSLEVGPQLSRERSATQYVTAYADPAATATFGTRYVFATLDQHQVAAQIRLNWLFSPTLSLQLFAQPLISAGAYSDYKALAAARTYAFHHWNDGTSSFDSTTFTPPAQDFNFRSLRGNLVLRWEYRPGSTLYLVWTQSRSDVQDIGALDFGHSVSRLTAGPPDNIFLVKVSYWWAP